MNADDLAPARITEKARQTIINGLRVAAEQYRHDAQTMHAHSQPRLAAQFERQAAEAEQVAAELEDL